MKYFLTSLVLALFCVVGSHSQITITSDEFLFEPGIDTIIAFDTLPIADIRGENKNWNIFFNGGQMLFNKKLSPSVSPFPDALYFYDSIANKIITGRYVYTQDFYATNGNYMAGIGYSCIAQNYYIGDALPGGMGNINDSLTFASYTKRFDEPIIYYRFPITYGYTNSSSSVVDLNGKLTITNYMINKTSMTKRSIYSIKDTVVGWGKMCLHRVQYPIVDRSDTLNVLIMRREATTVDSFFLKDLPALQQTLLTAFGITQGAVTKQYIYYFLSENLKYPVIKAISNQENMSSFEYVYVNSAVFTKHSSGVANEANESKSPLKIYPNPAIDNITISYDGANISNEISVYNSFGQIVKKISLLESNGQFSISDLEAGIYYVQTNGSKDRAMFAKVK